MSLLSLKEARAKALAAKQPLGDAMPFVSSFLRPFPVTVVEEPRMIGDRVLSSYVTPAPECVLGLPAVSRYYLSELRVLLLHEAGHVLGDVFGRCGERDWDTWVMADDLKVNAWIQEEMNRLNRLGMNGVDRRTALLAWPHDDPPALDYQFYGWTTEAIYDELIEAKKRGETLPYPEHKDCPEEFRGNPSEIRQGHERMRRAAMRAALESQEAGMGSSALQDLALAMARPKLSWSMLLAQAIETKLDSFERRSYLHPRARDWERGDGLLVPGVLSSGKALAVAPDVSGSSAREGGPAARFVGEVQGAAAASDAPVRMILWDEVIRLDRSVECGQPIKPLLRGVQGAAGTRIRCLLERLRRIAYEPSGSELPEPGFLVILTDGAVEDWPKPSEWPCEILVVYTHKAPPSGYESIHMEVA